MSEFRVEDGVAVPARAGKKSKYPWENLKPDQSFFVPDGKKQSITSSAYRYGKDHDMKFTIREVTENGVTGVRVWRKKEGGAEEAAQE